MPPPNSTGTRWIEISSTRQGVVVGVAAAHHRPDLLARLGEELHAPLVPAEGPLVEPLAAVAHRLVRPHVRRGYEAVQGHADVEDHLGHLNLRLLIAGH
jgi:hypothetical protein